MLTARSIHALTDVIGRPNVLMLTPGNYSDVKAAPASLERAGTMRYLLGDKGYDADRPAPIVARGWNQSAVALATTLAFWL